MPYTVATDNYANITESTKKKQRIGIFWDGEALATEGRETRERIWRNIAADAGWPSPEHHLFSSVLFTCVFVFVEFILSHSCENGLIKTWYFLHIIQIILQKLYKFWIGNWYPAVVEIKKGPFLKFYCLAQFRALSEMIKATMIDWMCNPDNSAKAAPFLFVADTLFTLLTVKVILSLVFW